ncbi:MAG: trehalose-6-phosphate synthase [Myxococcota bacterium]
MTQARVPLSQKRMEALVRERFAGRRLVVVSNREPVVHQRGANGKLKVQQPAGGLTTAMLPIVQACRGVWIAHGSGNADFDVTDARDGLEWPPENPSFRLRRVRLPPDVEAGYYNGLANEGIWPLCHLAYTAPLFRHSDWVMYREANRIFSEAVLEEIGDEPAVVFSHDYHLGLLQRMLRNRRPDLLMAQFWHIPWPNREVMGVMPWMAELLHGMLGNDLMGFHVQQHCNNFLDTVDRGIESLVDYENHRAIRGRKSTYVRPFPISIDVHAYQQTAAEKPFEKVFPELAARTHGQVMLLGVDRLDYTKGIPHRLRAFESLLEQYPEWRGKATFVQIGAPSRTTIPRYAALADEVQALVRQINSRFGGQERWTAVHYLPEHHDREMLAALYRRADVCMVTSLHDGMNLVAKEYIAAHAGTPGTLVLSKFTGAARELLEACLVNPYDIEATAALIVETLRMSPQQRADAMRRLYERVCAHDVYDWATDVLTGLDEVSRRQEAQAFPGN